MFAHHLLLTLAALTSGGLLTLAAPLDQEQTANFTPVAVPAEILRAYGLLPPPSSIATSRVTTFTNVWPMTEKLPIPVPSIIAARQEEGRAFATSERLPVPVPSVIAARQESLPFSHPGSPQRAAATTEHLPAPVSSVIARQETLPESSPSISATLFARAAYTKCETSDASPWVTDANQAIFYLEKLRHQACGQNTGAPWWCTRIAEFGNAAVGICGEIGYTIACGSAGEQARHIVRACKTEKFLGKCGGHRAFEGVPGKDGYRGIMIYRS